MGRDPRATPARQPSTLPMSGDGKRSVAEWPKLPRPSSTAPKQTSAAPGGIGPKVWLARQVLESTLGWSHRSRSKRNYGSLNQISQSIEFKALRKPPNALSRQGSVSLAAFERSEMVVRLISVVFGFDLGSAAVVTFFDLGSCDGA